MIALACGFAGMSTTNSSPIIAALGGKHMAWTSDDAESCRPRGIPRAPAQRRLACEFAQFMWWRAAGECLIDSLRSKFAEFEGAAWTTLNSL